MVESYVPVFVKSQADTMKQGDFVAAVGEKAWSTLQNIVDREGDVIYISHKTAKAVGDTDAPEQTKEEFLQLSQKVIKPSYGNSSLRGGILKGKEVLIQAAATAPSVKELELEKKLSALEGQRKRELKEWKEKGEEQEKLITSLRKELRQEKEATRALQKTHVLQQETGELLQQAKDQADSLKKELVKLEETVSRKDEQIGAYRKRAEEYAARLAVEEGVAAKLRKDLQESSVYFDEYSADTEEQLKELKEQVETLQKEAAQMQEKQEFEGKVDEMSTEAVNAFWEGLLRIYQVAKEEVPRITPENYKEFFHTVLLVKIDETLADPEAGPLKPEITKEAKKELEILRGFVVDNYDGLYYLLKTLGQGKLPEDPSKKIQSLKDYAENLQVLREADAKLIDKLDEENAVLVEKCEKLSTYVSQDNTEAGSPPLSNPNKEAHMSTQNQKDQQAMETYGQIFVKENKEFMGDLVEALAGELDPSKKSAVMAAADKIISRHTQKLEQKFDAALNAFYQHQVQESTWWKVAKYAFYGVTIAAATFFLVDVAFRIFKGRPLFTSAPEAA